LLRKLTYSFLSFIILLIALVFGLLAFLNLESGRSTVASMIESFASTEDMQINIEGLQQLSLSGIRLDKVILSDQEGPFAEINEIVVDYSLSSLLGDVPTVDRIAIESARVARQPDLPVSETSDSQESSGLPALAIREIELGTLALEEAVIGRPSTLSARGDVEVMPTGGLQASLSGEIDGNQGQYEITVNRSAETSPFEGRLNWQEQANGLLLALLGRETGPPITINLDLNALNDSQGLSGVLAAGQTSQFKFDSVIHQTDAFLSVQADAQGSLEEFMPPGLLPLAPGDITLTANIEAGNNTLDIKAFDFSTGVVEAKAAGSLSPNGDNLRADIVVAPQDGAPLTLELAEEQSLIIRRTDLALLVSPYEQGSALRLSLRSSGLETDKIATGSFRINSRAEAANARLTEAETLPFALEAIMDAFRVIPANDETPNGATVRLTADGVYDKNEGVQLSKAEAVLPGGTISFDGSARPEGFDGTLKIAFEALSELQAILSQPLQGQLNATVTGEGYLNQPSNLTFQASANGIQTGIMQADAVLNQAVELEGSFEGTASDASVVLSRLQTRGGLSANGSVSMNNEALDGSFTFALEDLATIEPRASGRLEGDVALSGTTQAPIVDAELQLASGQLMDKPVEDLVAQLQAEVSEALWRLNLTLSGSLDNQPVEGSANLRSSDQALPIVETLNLNLAGNTLRGQAQPLPSGGYEGAFQLNAPNLESVGALALTELSGSLNADIQIEGGVDNISTRIQAQGADITVPSASIGRADIDLNLTSLLTRPQISGQANLSNVNAGGQSFSAIAFNTRSEGSATLIDINALGQAISSDITLALIPEGEQTQIISRGGDVRYQGIEATLREGSTIILENGAVTLDAVFIAVAGGTISVDGSVMPQLGLQANLDSLNAASLSQVVEGVSAQGSLSGEANIIGELSNPQINWQVNGSGLGMSAGPAARLPGLGLSASGNGNLNSMSINADITTADATNLNANGIVSINNQRIDITVDGSASLALANAFIERETQLTGRANVNINVQGPFAGPAINGTITLSNAAVRDVATAIALTGMSGTLQLSGDTLQINNINGSIAAGGSFTVNGSLGIQQTGLPADLTISVRDGRYSDGTTVRSEFAGDLNLSGQLLNGGLLSGVVDVSRLEITIPQNFGTSGVDIKVRHRNEAPGFEPPIKEAKPATASNNNSSDLRLDLRVNAQNNVLVRGFGLDAELGGSIQLSGTTSSPITAGGFELIRGRIEFLSRRFDFTRGQITFEGDPVPYLNFVAETQRTDLTIYVTVQGPANNPSIDFSSSPELPSEEVLSRIVFDRGLGELSPVQAARLADLAAQLSGAIQGPGVFDSLRGALGVDNLDIRDAEGGGTTVGIEKNINERLRLGVEQNTGQGSSRVKVDLDVGAGVSIQGSAGSQGDSRLGIAIEREY
jgi:translocation and assembly module TamB